MASSAVERDLKLLDELFQRFESGCASLRGLGKLSRNMNSESYLKRRGPSPLPRPGMVRSDRVASVPFFGSKAHPEFLYEPFLGRAALDLRHLTPRDSPVLVYAGMSGSGKTRRLFERGMEDGNTFMIYVEMCHRVSTSAGNGYTDRSAASCMSKIAKLEGAHQFMTGAPLVAVRSEFFSLVLSRLVYLYFLMSLVKDTEGGALHPKEFLLAQIGKENTEFATVAYKLIRERVVVEEAPEGLFACDPLEMVERVVDCIRRLHPSFRLRVALDEVNALFEGDPKYVIAGHDGRKPLFYAVIPHIRQCFVGGVKGSRLFLSGTTMRMNWFRMMRSALGLLPKDPSTRIVTEFPLPKPDEVKAFLSYYLEPQAVSLIMPYLKKELPLRWRVIVQSLEAWLSRVTHFASYEDALKSVVRGVQSKVQEKFPKRGASALSWRDDLGREDFVTLLYLLKYASETNLPINFRLVEDVDFLSCGLAVVDSVAMSRLNPFKTIVSYSIREKFLRELLRRIDPTGRDVTQICLPKLSDARLCSSALQVLKESVLHLPKERGSTFEDALGEVIARSSSFQPWDLESIFIRFPSPLPALVRIGAAPRPKVLSQLSDLPGRLTSLIFRVTSGKTIEYVTSLQGMWSKKEGQLYRFPFAGKLDLVFRIQNVLVVLQVKTSATAVSSAETKKNIDQSSLYHMFLPRSLNWKDVSEAAAHRLQLLHELRELLVEGKLEGIVRLHVECPRSSPLAHRGFSCDGCAVEPIPGVRYHCQDCVDFDLCQACFVKKTDLSGGDHDASHTFKSDPALNWLADDLKTYLNPEFRVRCSAFEEAGEENVHVKSLTPQMWSCGTVPGDVLIPDDFVEVVAWFDNTNVRALVGEDSMWLMEFLPGLGKMLVPALRGLRNAFAGQGAGKMSVHRASRLARVPFDFALQIVSSLPPQKIGLPADVLSHFSDEIASTDDSFMMHVPEEHQVDGGILLSCLLGVPSVLPLESYRDFYEIFMQLGLHEHAFVLLDQLCGLPEALLGDSRLLRPAGHYAGFVPLGSSDDATLGRRVRFLAPPFTKAVDGTRDWERLEPFMGLQHKARSFPALFEIWRQSLWENDKPVEASSDLIVQCVDNVVKCHQTVLMSRSERFSALCEGSAKDDDKIHRISCDLYSLEFLAFLELLYKDNLPSREWDGLELIRLLQFVRIEEVDLLALLVPLEQFVGTLSHIDDAKMDVDGKGPSERDSFFIRVGDAVRSIVDQEVKERVVGSFIKVTSIERPILTCLLEFSARLHGRVADAVDGEEDDRQSERRRTRKRSRGESEEIGQEEDERVADGESVGDEDRQAREKKRRRKSSED